MKRIMLLDIARESRKIRQLLVTGRTFVILSLCSMLFFVAIGIAGIAHQRSSSTPISSMKGFAAAVSSGLFGDMLEMEMPAFQSKTETEALNNKQIGSFIIRLMTDINPSDPKSMLAGEIPGLDSNKSILIRKGVGTDTAVGPEDNVPITNDPADQAHADETPFPAESAPEPTETPRPTEKPGIGGKATTEGRKVAFIYHSHNRESWYPELNSTAKDPNSDTKNITLVGKRLAEQLEDLGIGSMHSDTDYPTAIKDYRWELSYKYSMKTVKEALASSEDLKFLFDIHRDSQKRKYTTVDIGGKSYAQVYFIIGHKNPNWKKNESFATRIHEKLEKSYPGISRGIFGKTAATGNGEYNQSLAEDSVLIEIGGVDNTLAESYRTVDVLAQIIADIYWDAEKVSAPES
ncbi:stage II sporulation protein P [Paenibacillus sp. NEAU-GSW1]|uniref:stage II sporulation protein P n=1 Tax=Paenibacillus sp. NEAU-GSW1 TaxID=2682486 RepID=UPI0012E329B4|nr:stage II sporulation protein P [Paenibacillus sp. NEAU-GSW1]MUT66642.1 stage II sporulation protein P [Paenibacillus sp. NEAU-GSW1]